MDTESVVIAYFIYAAIEVAFRVSVLLFFTDRQSATWKLVKPHPSMIFSPGYWISDNCKEIGMSLNQTRNLRSKLITNFNKGNIVISGIFLLIVLSIQIEEFRLLNLTISVITWRFISRSVEITIAFANDIKTPKRLSTLDNSDRMKLAIRSYIEIFIYSAAFYAAVGKSINGFWQSILAAFYVGTLTNVAEVAKSLNVDPQWVFLQVFATLSLVILSIAGYFGKVKSN